MLRFTRIIVIELNVSRFQREKHERLVFTNAVLLHCITCRIVFIQFVHIYDDTRHDWASSWHIRVWWTTEKSCTWLLLIADRSSYGKTSYAQNTSTRPSVWRFRTIPGKNVFTRVENVTFVCAYTQLCRAAWTARRRWSTGGRDAFVVERPPHVSRRSVSDNRWRASFSVFFFFCFFFLVRI